MRRNLLVLMLGMVLAGCGGRPEAPPEGFVNQTHHSDADLWTIWKAAQESLAQEIDLNPCSVRSQARQQTSVRETRVRSRSRLTNSASAQSQTSSPACCWPPQAWTGTIRPA
jgi:hypothetical protein